jgi:mannose-6-phosphate isomerase
MKTAYKLQGKHRHYDWGGKAFIPQLMQVQNTAQKPFAEYWMGAHPSAASTIEMENGIHALDALIQAEPIAFLGAQTQSKFGSLPYLFKILDVAEMLSIQVHPSKQNAIIGFDKEEALGIPIDASNRNYKDRNHKPEVMVALSDFWLLHGFLAPTLLEARLQKHTYFHSLLAHFKGENYESLYRYFMQLSNEEADQILKPLMLEAVAAVQAGQVDKSHPHWWANKYYKGIVPEANIDKGIFSIYILNIVQVPKYHGVFQGAGLLHAYLEGQNIELMANSDNVLRGGLTPKHIDIEALLQHIHFEPTIPSVLSGLALNSFETVFPCPVPDFGLSKIAIQGGQHYTIHPVSLEMLLVTEGVITVNEIRLSAGEVAVLLPHAPSVIQGIDAAVAFKSFVP